MADAAYLPIKVWNTYNGRYMCRCQEIIRMDDLVISVGREKKHSSLMSHRGGRVLYAHGIVYIHEGRGYFEDFRTSRTSVQAGTFMYLFPEKWHCYDPDLSRGWQELWVLFNGDAVQRYMGDVLSDSQSVFTTVADASLVELHDCIAQRWVYGTKTSQAHISYALHRFLYELYTRRQKETGVVTSGEQCVEDARASMYQCVDKPHFDVHAYARQKGVGYETFRKSFKLLTGYSPLQYFHALKLRRCCRLLLTPQIRIKQVSSMAGFEDPYYFSRWFRHRMGMSPQKYRHRHFRLGTQHI